MRSRICSSEKRIERFGLLNSELTCAEEVANLFLLLVLVLVEQEFAYVLRGATYYASSSFRSNDSQKDQDTPLRFRSDVFCGSRVWARGRYRTLPANPRYRKTSESTPARNACAAVKC